MTPERPPWRERSWQVVPRQGRAGALHDLAWPAPVVRTVLPMALDREALVLGSTQRLEIVAPGVEAAGCDVVQRRSGGGAVLLRPADSFWVDVLVPRDDDLWVDDVGRSFAWLGDVWIRALRHLEMPGAGGLRTHRGPLRRTPAGDLACFAGLGPGEVVQGSRKVVGLSQRRTRAGARFQCLAYLGRDHPAAAIVPLLAEPTGAAARAALEAQLRDGVASVPEPADAVLDAFLAALPE